MVNSGVSVQNMIEKINLEEAINWDEVTPKVAAVLIYEWFSRLPEPILTDSLYQAFIQAKGKLDCEVLSKILILHL